MSDWILRGNSHVCGLDQLPDSVLDLNGTEMYAVFSDGEKLLLVPNDDVEPPE